MLQREHAPQSYRTENAHGISPGLSLTLTSTEPSYPASFSFEVIRPNLFRTTFTSPSHLLTSHPSAEPPSINLGRVKPNVTSSINSQQLVLGDIVVKITWEKTPLVSIGFDDGASPLHEDLPFRSYCFDGRGVAHFTRYQRDTLHCGLGEKAAPMDLSGRRFELSATDCFGYDVYKTDPMYKHIPLLINATAKGCVAMFSTTHARGSYSIGADMDGMWGRYKVYRQDYGGLEQYLMVGRTLAEVVSTYAELVGYPQLVPRWAFGYIAGGMKYSMLDGPPTRASEAILEFARRCRKEDIPCSGFQLSSGYTIAEQEPKTRNVFTWNRHRFPDPKAWVDEMHANGIRIVANVKPYVLSSHPEYNALKRNGALFHDPVVGGTAVARLWSAGGGESGEGGHIDFTSRAGFKWWYDGIQSLRKLGIDSMWNDNNEYLIPSDDWRCKLDEPSVKLGTTENAEVGNVGRALQTELMAKSSHDALIDLEPNVRPSVLTRSATAGTMKYCGSSWSGDNVTSWAGMKGANALSLNAGLSLLQFYGHDIGGFEGPQPTPELLIRWIQLGIHTSRFAINCFKTSAFIDSADNKVGDVIEPWMYPSVTALVRKVFKRRYELIPYLYSLHLESHLFATPPQRWIGWGCEADDEVWRNEVLKRGEEQYWLGDTLLVGGVFEPGVTMVRIYLPKVNIGPDSGYVNLNSPYQHFASGQWVAVSSPWQESIPLFARVGGAIVVGKDVQTLAPGEKSNPAKLPLDDYRAVEIFPPDNSTDRNRYSTTWYEDDGISLKARISKFMVSYEISSKDSIGFGFWEDLSSGFVPQWKELHVVLPVGDERCLELNGQSCDPVREDNLGRKVFCVPAWHKQGAKI